MKWNVVQPEHIGRHLLVTGGAGFIGSNFIPYYLKNNPNSIVINLDKLTYAGNLAHLSEVENNNRYNFIEGDICNKDLIHDIFGDYHIDSIIHFAAESHVDNSITGPKAFIDTNINGTFTLLEAAKSLWLTDRYQPRKSFENARFHHISTDEVFGTLGEKGYFNENTPYAPNSPYSASKAASDFLVRSYHHTYGLNVVTSNCSNNYGPKQHDEKLIPTIVRRGLRGQAIPIYGSGENVRDWLFVKDHCEGIEKVFRRGVTGETYVIGGNNEQNNLSIARKICHILDEWHPKKNGSYAEQITFVKDRPGHDYRYAIDARKINSQLHWQPTTDFEEGLRQTVQWFAQKYLE
ncbi:dTDP-glucose 4,6-dehydratase [Pareuzebyella sediminis]|uniref:dTDP-glucose 4,6-dehydratase n=1 Tax=Pareuzebyella sediminis TaxID=2607998 RepID=UPI001E2F903B|nr:dTDP-glucose 4,6-dehydratase [Pareuzebyella sediminis]